jgi:hypothetical protein
MASYSKAFYTCQHQLENKQGDRIVQFFHSLGDFLNLWRIFLLGKLSKFMGFIFFTEKLTQIHNNKPTIMNGKGLI